MIPRVNQLSRVLVIAAALAAGPAGAAPASFAAAVAGDSPIAWWRFNETTLASPAADSSGSGNAGTYSATGITLGQPGLFGGDNAALFDGVNGRVVVPDAPGLNPPRITMEALVQWSGSLDGATQQRIFEKSFFADETQAQYGLSILADGHVRVELRSSGAIELTSSAVVPTGVPLYLAATFAVEDSNLIKLYINGVLDAALTHPFPNNFLQSGPLSLGLGNQVTRVRPFNGTIDEIALYDRALTAAELGEHMAAVPEPSSWALLAAGLLALLAVSWRRRSGAV